MSLKSFCFGVGICMVFLSLVFGLIYNLDSKKNVRDVTEPVISDDEIIDRARKLGMIYFVDLPESNENDLTDDEIIKRASEMGMVFIDDSATENNDNDDTSVDYTE